VPDLNGHTSGATNGIATGSGIIFAVFAAPFIHTLVFTEVLPELVPLYGRDMGQLAAWLIVIVLTYIAFFGVKASLLFAVKLIGAGFALLISR